MSDGSTAFQTLKHSPKHPARRSSNTGKAWAITAARATYIDWLKSTHNYPSKPNNAASWQQLPGIGPYTAAAISSIIYNQAIAVVDGNVVRILSRLVNDQKQYSNSSAAVKACSEQAQDLLDPTNPGDHNQAMMELGATICTKHNPKCPSAHSPPIAKQKIRLQKPSLKIVRKKRSMSASIG